MKIGIAGPMTLNLLDFDFKGAEIPKGYPFPLISNIINALRARGHEIVAYTTSWDVKETKVFNDGKFTICVCPRWRNAGRTFFKMEKFWLEKAMREYPADIINAQWSYEFGLAAQASGIPTVLTIRDHATTILKYERSLFALTRWWMNRMALKNGANFITNSEYLYKLLPSKVQSKSRVVSNFYKEGLEQNFEEHQEKQNYIISIANLSNRRKNLTGGVQAFQLLRKKYPDLKYYLVGKGSEPDGWIYEYAKKNQLLEGLEFIGPKPFAEVIQYIKNAKLLLHPSREESFGNVVLEAMVVGTPTVGGKNSGNIPYLLDFGNTGIPCDVNKPQEMAAAMSQILSNEALAQQFRKKAYQFALDNFSQKVVIDKLIQYYQDIISQKK